MGFLYNSYKNGFKCQENISLFFFFVQEQYYFTCLHHDDSQTTEVKWTHEKFNKMNNDLTLRENGILKCWDGWSWTHDFMVKGILKEVSKETKI